MGFKQFPPGFVWARLLPRIRSKVHGTKMAKAKVSGIALSISHSESGTAIQAIGQQIIIIVLPKTLG